VIADLPAEVLEFLENFGDYGKLMSSEEAGPNEDSKAFQKLVVLIRDWTRPAQFKYGDKGGKTFLAGKLSQSQFLSKSSEGLECFLMPSPAEDVRSPEVLKTLAGLTLSSNFSRYAHKFISDLLNPDDVPVKSIGMIPITNEH